MTSHPQKPPDHARRSTDSLASSSPDFLLLEDSPPGSRDDRPRRGEGPAVTHWFTEGQGHPESRRRDVFYRCALMLADVLSVAAAFAFAVVLVAGREPNLATLIGLPLLMLSSKLAGLYDRDELLIRKTTTVDEIPRLFYVATLFALLAAVGGRLVTDEALREGGLLALWLSLFVFLVLFRAAARSFALRSTATERCLVVGDADAWARLEAVLEHSPHANSRVLGYVPLHPRRADDAPPLGDLSGLDAVLRDAGVERVILAPRDTDSDLPLDVVRRVKARGVRVSVVPRIFEVAGSSVEFDDVESITLLGLRRFGLTPGARGLKRSFDLLGALVATIALLPLLLACALAIRLDSAGPILFRQRRVGRDGEVFEIVKFRTMVADAEARKAQLVHESESTGLFKMSDDPRITRVGRSLRRSSMDELPQLLNVLKGDMSLVGPRPLVLDEDRQVVGWHRRRLHLKPGITGPWQILSSGRVPLYEMVKLDYLYIANWSLWIDMKILLRTITYSLARRGL